jgi:hypothetical protein
MFAWLRLAPRRAFLSARNLALALLVVPAVLAGCGHDSHVAPVATRPITATDLSGQSYNLLVRNADQSVILLGHLRFGAVQPDGTVTGTWDLSPWGAETAVPDLPASGALTGTLAGSTLIVRLPLPSAGNSLGLVAGSFVNERLTGRISLLPAQSFDAGFEAIAAN